MFYAGTGGSIYDAVTRVGYSICDNDFYRRYNGITFQPFYRQGTNIDKVAANPEAAQFSYLGGVYDLATRTWTTKRVHKTVAIPKTSNISVIEKVSGATRIIN
jgi:hypothetical protein